MLGRAGVRHGLGRSAHAPDLPDHHHRDLAGGGLRAAIFGVSDGLVSNVSLVLGTAGAHVSGDFVRLAGLAGLLGGSFSMAAGEYVSMRAQREVFEHELEVERLEIRDHPESERRELEGIYVQRGVDPEVAESMTREIMADPEVALSTHAREELGVDPSSFGSPVQASLSSFVSFAIGALIPLLPFVAGAANGLEVLLAVGLTAIGALVVGTAIAHFTARSRVLSALRSLGICAGAGGVTYLVGHLLGH